MAITLDTLKSFLNEEKLQFDVHNEEKQTLITGFNVSNFTDMNGNKGITIFLQLVGDGTHLQIWAPSLYKFDPSKDNPAFLAACLMIQAMAPLGAFEMDQEGTVLFGVEVPIEDGSLTHSQVMRSLFIIPEVVDHFDRTLRDAKATGEIRFPEPSGTPEASEGPDRL